MSCVLDFIGLGRPHCRCNRVCFDRYIAVPIPVLRCNIKRAKRPILQTRWHFANLSMVETEALKVF